MFAITPFPCVAAGTSFAPREPVANYEAVPFSRIRNQFCSYPTRRPKRQDASGTLFVLGRPPRGRPPPRISGFVYLRRELPGRPGETGTPAGLDDDYDYQINCGLGACTAVPVFLLTCAQRPEGATTATPTVPLHARSLTRAEKLQRPPAANEPTANSETGLPKARVRDVQPSA